MMRQIKALTISGMKKPPTDSVFHFITHDVDYASDLNDLPFSPF